MGQLYGGATGHKVPIMGEQQILGVLPGGTERAMTWQVAEVTRPLLSVGKMCDAGHQVLFGRNGGGDHHGPGHWGGDAVLEGLGWHVPAGVLDCSEGWP